jgi:hypothetical protein
MDPRTAWWTIHGDAIYDALARVASGEHPEVVWLELVAASESETVGGR